MTGKISSKRARSGSALAALTLLVGLLPSCGSGGDALGSGNSGAGVGGALGLDFDGGVLDPSSSGGLGVALGGGAASVGGAAASGAAAGGACAGANCAPSGPGKASGATCTMPDECQSGRCEPVTGVSTEACLAACFSDGVACTRALDCCSTGCLSGKCGGQCKVIGDGCAANADCCSNVCEAGECQVDMPNRDCRPTGEDCGKGSGSGCCNTCNKQTGRCDFGPDTCFAQGVACTADAQCCHGECLSGTCTTLCVAQAGACTADADCCSVSCVAGQCQPPPGAGAGGSSGVGGNTGVGGGAATCTLTGQSCASDGACCSSNCFGGFCEAPVR
jgi:hypothetical protein